MKSIRKLFEASYSTVSATLAVSPAEFRYFTSPSILQVRVRDNDMEETQVYRPPSTHSFMAVIICFICL